MSKQTKSKPTFEIGQILYVSISGWLSRNNEPKLYEYVVTRFNGTSVYAKRKEFPDHRETRFTIRSMTASNGIGDHYRAYTDPSQYWNKIERAKKKREVHAQVKESVDTLTLGQLEAVRDFIKNL